MAKSKKLKNPDCRGAYRYYKKVGDNTFIIHGLSRYWRRSSDMIDFESGPALFKGSSLLDGKNDLGVIKDMKIIQHESSEIVDVSDKIVKMLKNEFDVTDQNKEHTLKMNIMSAISSFLSDWVKVEVTMEVSDGKDKE
jgi:hypothetical protein